MEEKRMYHRELYLGALLVLALSVAHGIGDGRTLRWIRPLWDFVQLAAAPGLVFLFGSLSRTLINTKERLIRYAMACGELYLLQKLLIFWARVAMGRTPSFHIFSSANAPWLYFVFTEYLLLTLLAEGRQWKRNVVFGISVAAGCLCGLFGWIGDNFCLGRMLVFLPFFLAGRWGDGERLDGFLRRRAVRLGGLVFTAGTLLVCVKKAKFLYKMSGFLDGDQPFALLPPSLLARVGPLSRLAWYGAVFCLVLALLALMPRRKLGPLDGLCAGWPLAYLWQRPITTVFAGLVMKQLVERMGNKGYLPGTVLMILVLLITYLPWALRPLRTLVRRANFWRAPPAERLAPARERGRFRPGPWGRSALIFTGVFLVLTVALLLPLFGDGRSMVWRVDGLRQIYPGMIFLRRYLRGVIKTFLATGTLRFNQYTFQAGMGMGILDVIRRDPIGFLCVLAPAKHMEATYAVLSLVRMWLAGLAFLWLCRELEREDVPAMVLGAVSFAFCGFSLYVMIRQPGLQTPWLIYFPLMIAGVERFLRRRKGGLFLAMVCLSFVVGYYLAYISTLLMALYLLVRLIDIHEKDVRAILTEIGKMIGIYFWGMALAAVTLLPTFYSYLTCSRTGEIGRKTSLLFYDWGYYECLFCEVVKGVPNYGQKWSIVSFAGLTLLSMVLLFLRKDRKLRSLKAGVILCTVMVCMPLFGRVMNGFGYVSNRWTYGFALVGSLVLVYMLPAFLTLTRREKLTLLVVGGLYLGLALTRDDLLKGAWYTGLLLLAVSLLAVTVLDFVAADAHQKRVVLSLTMVLSMAVSLSAAFHPLVGDYAGECLDAGEVQDKLTSSPVRAVKYLPEEEGFCRVEQPGLSYNQAMAMNFYGTSAYFSVLPGQMSQMYMDLCMNTVTQSFDLRGFDERASLMALGSVGYYLTDQSRVPYGFTQVGEEDGVRIYKNDYALPLGYTYTSCMSENAYERLSFAEKQQALLQHAVVPNGQLPEELDKGMARLTAELRPCKVTAKRDVKIDTKEKTIKVREDGGSVTFRIDALPDSETYLYLAGIGYADPASESVSTLEVEAEGMVTRACVRGRQQNYYYNNRGIAFNLGYGTGGERTCTLTFNEAGEFSYRGLMALSLPMKDYVSDVTARREVVLEQVREDGDRISGEITLPDDRLLALSIPYSKGWTLYVDGEKTPLMEVNRMYLGAVLKPGHHNIELRYTMPWLRAGAVISGLALLALAGRGAWGLARRRRGAAAETREERQEDDTHDPL